jgi:hypothetical protein
MSRQPIGTAAELGGKKTEKVLIQTNKMFKSLVQSIPAVDALTSLMGTLESALGFMAPLQAIFDVINGLFGVMGAQILPVIMEVLRPFLNLLMSLKPIFILIGTIISLIVEVALIPITIALEIFMAILTPFLPLIEALIPIFKAISPLIKILADLLLLVLTPVLNTISAVILLVARGIAFVLNVLIDAINLIPFVNLPRIPAFQQGIDFVPRTGPALVHRGEQILSAGQRNEMLGALEESNRTQKALLNEMKQMRIDNEPQRHVMG